MADRPPPPRSPYSGNLLHHRRIHPNSPSSLQLLGILTLLLTGAVLLLLTGVTLTVAFLALIFFSPVILLLSPIWVPIAALLFFAAVGLLFLCGSALAAAAGGYWLYRYFRGQHPIGSERVDYATSRIVSTASHVRDYAREYGGGYFHHGKVKDAAPGA